MTTNEAAATAGRQRPRAATGFRAAAWEPASGKPPGRRGSPGTSRPRPWPLPSLRSARHHKIEEYRGNYSLFTRLKEERDAQLQASATRQSKEIARVQKFVDRFRYQANKASQVQSRLKQLDKVKRIEIQRDPKRVKFRFPLPSASGRQVLDLVGASKRYGEKVVYKTLDFSVERGQRVALVGENGAGKSTLLKMLSGILSPDTGTRTVGHGVTVHYFAQHQAETLNPEHSVLESLEEVTKHAEMNFLRGIAGAFLFSGQDQKKPIKALSGGERNRVASRPYAGGAGQYPLTR